jgi:hypothetical protein
MKNNVNNMYSIPLFKQKKKYVFSYICMCVYVQNIYLPEVYRISLET